MSNQTWIWTVVFTAFAVSATVFLMVWASSEPSWWGFPSWIFPFLSIHFGFSAAVWAFTRYYWKEENGDD
jgi:cytochrome b561